MATKEPPKPTPPTPVRERVEKHVPVRDNIREPVRVYDPHKAPPPITKNPPKK